ncbi:MAG: MFS transporter [Opitutaceae bacterium]|nr:MFS transporter [Opitutaceae bacterium]
MQFSNSLRALNSTNYRLFFAGQGLSMLGNWMTLTASAWLIYELSNNAFYLGFLPFANQIPVLLLAPLGGLLGDRLPRQRLMWWLNCACAAQAATLAILTLIGEITVTRLLILVTIRGFINAAEFPTRQAFIVDLVDRKEDLPNAIALNSSLFNAARLVGPAIAGIVIATAGPGVCYLIDATSYAAILTSILAMRLPRRRSKSKRRNSPFADLRAGVNYVRRTPGLQASLIMIPMIAFAGFASSTLAPIFARDVFGGDSKTLGLLFSSVGAGALVSAVMLARRPSPDGLANWILIGSFSLALGQLGVALSPWFWLTIICMMGTGFGTVLCMAGNNTLIQSQVADDKRSRVMGLFAMGQGMFPLGSLAFGGIAAAFGPRWAVALAAVATAGAGLQFIRARRQLHRIRPPRRPPPLPSDSVV